MLHNSKALRELVSDYDDKGWLDLDAIMEAIADQDKQENACTTQLSHPVDQRVDKVRDKILALMDLKGVSEAAKKAMRDGIFTEEQLEDLHNKWSEEIQKSPRTTPDKILSSFPMTRWRDFIPYRNGVQS